MGVYTLINLKKQVVFVCLFVCLFVLICGLFIESGTADAKPDFIMLKLKVLDWHRCSWPNVMKGVDYCQSLSQLRQRGQVAFIIISLPQSGRVAYIIAKPLLQLTLEHIKHTTEVYTIKIVQFIKR